jgi:nitrite reductase/ring-hydroxylating ferredoxin subunit
MSYQVEYRFDIHCNWLKAGFELSDGDLKRDFRTMKTEYRNGLRRAYKVSRIPVDFEESVTIVEKK